MPYAKLSDQVERLTNPQRSDAFVKLFRRAVRNGEVEAADLPNRFTLPKQFKRYGQGGIYQREVNDMVFEVTPAFKRWFACINSELSNNRYEDNSRIKLIIEQVETGRIDFSSLVASTRQKIEAAQPKDQNLQKDDEPESQETARMTQRRKETLWDRLCQVEERGPAGEDAGEVL